jgi:hypothetical protein
MSDLMSLVQRMEAFALGHAERITSHRHVAIQPHALVLAPIVMAGEETDIHIAAVGRIGAPARIRYVADPRRRDDLYARIISWLNRIVDPYFQWCLDHNTYPQLWVSSSAAAKLIDILSDRLRYARTPEAERLGHLLTYPGERQHHDGQQTLMAATRALRLHVATGQHVGEDEHLAALLTWIDPPLGVPIWDAVARAEWQPSGIKTDPAFDRLVLARLVQAYNKARRAHAPASALDARARAIGTALVPTVQPIYHDIQRAISFLHDLPCPDLPALSAFEKRETAEFTYFMGHINKGGRLSRRDTIKRAAQGLTAREDAVEQVAAAVRCSDRVARARGRLDGHIITGCIENLQRTREAPRRFRIEFDLVSTQRILRARLGDEIYWADNPRLGVAVTSDQRTGGQARLHVVLTSGSRLFGQLSNGLVLDFTTDKPEWSRLVTDSVHISRVLATPPWTHDQTPPPPPSPMSGPIPVDLLQALEDLR